MTSYSPQSLSGTEKYYDLLMTLNLEILPFYDENPITRISRILKAKASKEYFYRVYMPHRIKHDYQNHTSSYDDPVLGEIWNKVFAGKRLKSDEGKIEFKYNERLKQDLGEFR
jgi:hypothetical protein